MFFLKAFTIMKLLTSTLVLALALPTFADIFIMKDGSRIKADVIDRTPEEYVLDVYVTKSIKEQKTIKRSDIEKIERVSEADEDFKKIADLTPAPPFLKVADYDTRIKTLKDFVAKHKITTAGTKAAEMIVELEAEREIVAAGGVKTEEKVLTASERESDLVNVQSQELAVEFRELVEKRSYVAALRKFQQLENNFAASAAHREALPLYKQLLASYQLLITKELNEFEKKQMMRKKSFNDLSDSDQARLMAVEKNRMQQVEKIREAEDEKGVMWPAVDLMDEQSIATMRNMLQQRADSIPRIEQQIASMPDTGVVYREGWIAAGEKKPDVLDPLLDQLDAAGVSESTIDRLVDRFDPTLNNPPKEMMDKKMSEEDADTDPDPETAQ